MDKKKFDEMAETIIEEYCLEWGDRPDIEAFVAYARKGFEVQHGEYVPEGRIIIRTNADATLDEAILKDGKANFHLEQMSATHWWMALTLDQQRIDINLTSRATIKANVSDEGEVKLIDDSCAISPNEEKT